MFSDQLPIKAKPETLSYLPSGTFAKARLLNGATAPDPEDKAPAIRFRCS